MRCANTAVQVKRLAQTALSSGVDSQNKAQSCLILARACHADGQIQEAVSWYSQVSSQHTCGLCGTLCPALRCKLVTFCIDIIDLDILHHTFHAMFAAPCEYSSNAW